MGNECKDLTEVLIGEGLFSKKPALSPKKISLSELHAILYESPEIFSDSFVIKKTPLVFAFPYNRGKRWLREIKNFLLKHTAEEGQKTYSSLYKLFKGVPQTINGRLFLRTKYANRFSREELQKIGKNVLKRFVVLPRKFCALDAHIELNGDVSVVPGRFLHPETSGEGLYIYFSVNCQFAKKLKLLPLEYFNEKRHFYISKYGHQTSGRHGALRIVSHLLEYGNNLMEWPELSENQGFSYQTKLEYSARFLDFNR